MVSSKERIRIERQFDVMQERMNRQKESITRLLLANTEMSAALMEIADMDGSAPDGQTTPQEYAQERARRAIATVSRMAAATIPAEGESTGKQDPTTDEEKDT
jgi:hypothetical protein